MWGIFKKEWFIYRLFLNYFILVIWLGLLKIYVWVWVYLFWYYKEKKIKMIKGENLILVRFFDIGYKIKFEVWNVFFFLYIIVYFIFYLFYD